MSNILLSGSSILFASAPFETTQSSEVSASTISFVTNTSNVKAIWQISNLDTGSFELRVPSKSFNGTLDRIPFFISGSGKIGVNTTDPKTQFDIKSAEDSAEGTKFLLRSSRAADNPLQVGDSAGEIDFVVESGSFAKLETSGSIGRIKGEITHVTKAGARGKLVLGVGKDLSSDSIDIIEWKYASADVQNFAQIMSASLVIQDFSSTLISRIEMRDSDGTVFMSAQTGSMHMTGTGSFGLIEGGTF